MSYIVGTSLPRDKTLVYALTHVYGIGGYNSKLICRKAGLGQDCRVKDINANQLFSLTLFIESLNLMIGSNLRKFNTDRIRNLCDMVSYRGSRHRKGLPVRGQRTHTNSKRRPKFEWKKNI